MPPLITDRLYAKNTTKQCIVTCGSAVAQIQAVPGSCLLPIALAQELVGSAPLINVATYQGEDVGLVQLPDASSLPSTLVLTSLRDFLPQSTADEGLLSSRAVQLSHWLDTHKYCGRCGTKNVFAEHERALVCTKCGHISYPKIAPCVIGTVVKRDQVLLVHGHHHRDGIYSAVAGFIESGETAEQAFAREVKEETNIDICDIRYVESQPWPFPGQLMLGFVAHYKAGNIQIEERELVDAGWYSKDALPTLPADYTISYKLIAHALEQIDRPQDV